GSDRQALRVVSQPRRKKGALEMFACGDCGRIAVRRLARHRSSENGAIDRARRGDVVVIENRSTPAARLDLGANDRVFRLTPAAMGSE
ncbi:MAG TPA: hypothetical protein VFG83_12140, partial [Kofleriaceae bacterium]|nr:hypothetical protein [Kofleriaceae bacterium]